MYAANVLMHHFDIREVEGGRTVPSVENLARLIDAYTKSFKLKPALEKISNEIDYRDPYWIHENMEQAIEAARAIEMMDDELPHYEDEAQHALYTATGDAIPVSEQQKRRAEAMAARYQISATSVLCMQKIGERFDWIEKPGGKVRCTERSIAVIIDVCTRIFRVAEALHKAAGFTRGRMDSDLARDAATLRKIFEAVDIARVQMPSGSVPPMNLWKTLKVDLGEGLSNERKINLAKVTSALENARTSTDAVSVLTNATSDKLL